MSRRTAPRRRRRRALVPILLVLLGAVVLLYPVVATQFNNYQQHQFAREYRQDVDRTPGPTLRRDLRRARDYNKTLAGIPILDPWTTNDARARENSDYRRYLRELDLFDVMARVRVPDVGIDLPVYHGTSQRTLDMGVGHLYGTSLPVGGRGTHAVMTSHTGRNDATLFDNLVDVREGDTFYVDVDGTTLQYEVDSIKVVRPDRTQDLAVVPGRDLVTLFTCTPYSVNTHRLLVRGHRVPYDRDADTTVDQSPSVWDLQAWMWWLIVGAVAGLLLLLLLLLARRRRRRRGESAEPGSVDQGHPVLGVGVDLDLLPGQERRGDQAAGDQDRGHHEDRRERVGHVAEHE